MLLHYLAFESTVCPSCGSRDEDWVDEKGRLLAEPALEPHYRKCWGCHDLEQYRKVVFDAEGSEGTRVFLGPRMDDSAERDDALAERAKQRKLDQLAGVDLDPNMLRTGGY